MNKIMTVMKHKDISAEISVPVACHLRIVHGEDLRDLLVEGGHDLLQLSSPAKFNKGILGLEKLAEVLEVLKTDSCKHINSNTRSKREAHDLCKVLESPMEPTKEYGRWNLCQ